MANGDSLLAFLRCHHVCLSPGLLTASEAHFCSKEALLGVAQYSPSVPSPWVRLLFCWRPCADAGAWPGFRPNGPRRFGRSCVCPDSLFNSVTQSPVLNRVSFLPFSTPPTFQLLLRHVQNEGAHSQVRCQTSF